MKKETRGIEIIDDEAEEAESKYVKWFSELSKKDVAGGKGANLGEMYRIGMPVPQGFVISADAYIYFLEETELKDEIYKILAKLNIDDTAELESTARKIREMIEKAEMPSDMQEEILENYKTLGIDEDAFENAVGDALAILKKSYEPVFVAVRSSATAEDTKTASFAGQNETFLNVKGNTILIEAVKKCWASLFTARSIYYRIKKGFKHEDVLIAVIIQIMINADKSGVIFSRDPVKQDENIIIEAVFGLGEGIVSGKIQPDNYVVSRELKILNKNIVDKKIAIVRNSAGQTETVHLTEERSGSQVLSEYEIKKLADYALELEKHYKMPQDIEFAVDSGKIYIVQTRPITTLKKQIKKEIEEEKEISGREILQGIPASPGIGSGEVKIVRNLQDLSKIKKGDVLVTKMTNPDMVVAMQKCSAIVTDEGGLTAHAAIVSREMGIPCIVGTEKATEILKEGMIITVDGYTGKIYEGRLESLKEEKAKIEPILETKTKIKVIVDLPHFAERAAKTNAKEIGLTRIEGIIAESGKHPFYFLKNKRIHDYEKLIFSGISKIAENFEEIWVRTSDIRSDEYRHLEGSPSEIEANPMLGMHGIRAGLKYKEILKAELNAAKKLSEKKRVGIMLPQVISLEEVKEAKKIIEELGTAKSLRNLKIGIMIETPAAVQIIEELCQEGIDFISFGTNDLTQFTLAIDRGNEAVQYLYSETSPSVLKQLSHVIHICKGYGIETSICGQAGSNKEMVEFLVKNDIDSISVNADKAREISEFVRALETQGIKGIETKKEMEIEKIKQALKEQKLTEEEIHTAIEKEKNSGEKEEWQNVGIGIEEGSRKKQRPRKAVQKSEENAYPLITFDKLLEKQEQEAQKQDKQQEILDKIKQALEKAKENLSKKHSEDSSGLKVFDIQGMQKPDENLEIQKIQQAQQEAEAEKKIKEKEEKMILDSTEIATIHEKDIHKAVTEKSQIEQIIESSLGIKEIDNDKKEAEKKEEKEKKEVQAKEEILDIF